MDSASDKPDDNGRWMTYADLAEIRGVSLRAAVRMVQRQKLRKMAGNDGKVRVWVSQDMLGIGRTTTERGVRTDRAGSAQGVARALDMLAEALGRERDRADKAEARAERAEQRAQEAQQRADELRRADDARKAASLPRRILAALRRG